MKRLLLTTLCILILAAGCAPVSAPPDTPTVVSPTEALQPTPPSEPPATSIPASVPTPVPEPVEPLPSSAEPVYTVKDLLSAAIEPCGRCLYVWGGGWNEEDTAAGPDAMREGPSPRWYEFFLENGPSYDVNSTKYQIHDGLDCTGYLGYSVYQVFGDAYSQTGYVFPSGKFAAGCLALFGGENIPVQNIRDYKPGDIMHKRGHVFLVIGQCEDGSLLFLHASPPALSLCGTPARDGSTSSQAVALATEYMSKYRSECFEKYDTCLRGTGFLTEYDQYRWDENLLTDPDGYFQMTPREILDDLLAE